MKEKKKYTKAEQTELLTQIQGAVASGTNISQVVKEMGIPYRTYYGWLRRLKPTPTTKRHRHRQQGRQYKKKDSEHQRVNFGMLPDGKGESVSTSKFYFISGEPEEVARFLLSYKPGR